MRTGASVGGLLNLAAQLATPGARTDWIEVGAMTGVGAGFGLLADILEPATSPTRTPAEPLAFIDEKGCEADAALERLRALVPTPT